jgi:uncharacterized membrane protein
MAARNAFIWYLHGPNLLILAMICILFVQLLLSLAAGGSTVTRAISLVTRPVAAVGFITPRIVPPAGVIVLSIAWLMVARVALSMAALAKGVSL